MTPLPPILAYESTDQSGRAVRRRDRHRRGRRFAWAAVGPLLAVLVSAGLPGCEGSYGKGGPTSVPTWLVAVATWSVAVHTFQGHADSDWDVWFAAVSTALAAASVLLVAGPFVARVRARSPTRRRWQLADAMLLSPWAVMAMMAAHVGCTFLYGFYLLAVAFTAQLVVLRWAARAGRRSAALTTDGYLLAMDQVR